jgi:hypothetical protein
VGRVAGAFIIWWLSSFKKHFQAPTFSEQAKSNFVFSKKQPTLQKNHSGIIDFSKTSKLSISNQRKQKKRSVKKKAKKFQFSFVFCWKKK